MTFREKICFMWNEEDEIAQLKKCNFGKAPFLESVSSYPVLVYSACTVTISVRFEIKEDVLPHSLKVAKAKII